VILEVGAHLGHCTRVLSRLFQTVLALEHSPHVLKQNALRNADLKNVAPCD
jgi:protein-L-isoaspartate O-methyltransferase